MKQVLYHPQNSSPTAVELPDPLPHSGQVIITNRASVISPGTERASMDLHGASLFTKARRRPDLVGQVLHKVRTEGLVSTVRKVRSRLAEPLVPGYSAAGVVCRLGPGVSGFSVGDRVAAAGFGFAGHAELICVPVNLVAKIPSPVSFAEAAFGTLGAIAMHGVRVTAPTLGETVVVIGLGILGQLTSQILQAMGVEVIALEPVEFRRELALQSGITNTYPPGAAAEQAILELTDGRGADAVIITAASRAEELLNQSAELARDRAVITVVGDVPLTASRRLFYQKELQLRISRSYGPGRYDREYEEKGADYPLAYVRWTEQRNIGAFLELLAQQKVKVEHLITDRFTIDQAPEAYALLADKSSGSRLAFLFEYPAGEYQPKTMVQLNKPSRPLPEKETLGVGFIGCGRFATGVLLPAFQAMKGFELTGVATKKSVSAHAAAERSGFSFATTDPDLIINNQQTDLVVIATTHDQHANLAARALAAGKVVFVEKPLALDPAGLQQVTSAVKEYGGLLQVGFNRRFSPALVRIKEVLAGRRTPLSIDYRICAGPAPSAKTDWLTDPEIGGGRLLGEVCHFIDAASFLIEAYPTNVYARALGLTKDDDAVVLTLTYTDGSVANIRYLTNAAPGTPKEYLDITGGGLTAFVDDYRVYGWCGPDGPYKKRSTQDKGHRAQLKALLACYRTKGIAAGDFVAAAYATQATFAATESLLLGEPVTISLKF